MIDPLCINNDPFTSKFDKNWFIFNKKTYDLLVTKSMPATVSQLVNSTGNLFFFKLSLSRFQAI